MGNNATSCCIIVIGSGNGLIQAAQGQLRSIAVQGYGAQYARLIKQ
jgi:hypothetical protein